MIAKRIVIGRVGVLAIALIILILSALVDHVPDYPGLLNSPSANNPHLFHASGGPGEPPLVFVLRVSETGHCDASSRLPLSPEFFVSLKILTCLPIAGNSSPPAQS